jgi:nucleoside phosphorylase
MPMERKPLVRKLSLAKRVIDGVEVYAGTLGSHDVVAIVTGMGTRLAATGLERLLAATDVDRVVVVGITGALEDDTPIGALVLPETVVDGATGGEHRPAPLGPGAPEGAMWTADTLTTDPATLTELRARGVIALDMETAALAEVCEGRGIPWSVFRAISDRASDGTVDEEVFHLSNQDGTPNPAAVARYFVRHPGRLPAMARMAKGARLATETAADAAIAACSEL